jgi:rubrerythrin
MAFKAGEVLQMACQIERNGARFYREAAGKVRGPKAIEALKALADWEETHEKTFVRMAEGLPAGERPESSHAPGGELRKFLQAIAGDKVFSMLDDPVAWLGEAHSIDDILRKALQMEKDSIIFYLGIKEGIPAERGRRQVDEIIAQEMGHIRQLGDLIEG